MHRCQVKMRQRRETPNSSLLECGDIANKKVGLIWMCDFHWNRFGVSTMGEDHFATCTDAVDADATRESLTEDRLRNFTVLFVYESRSPQTAD